MDLLTPPDPAALTLPSPALSLSSEGLLRHEVATLPPGQSTAALQMYAQFFQEHFKALDVEKVGCGLVVGVVSSAQIFSLLLSHVPKTLWSGRSKVVAMACVHSLVEEVIGQAMSVLGTGETPPAGHTLQVTVLLLLSQCCELLTGLHQCPPPAVPPPAWPLRWTRGSPTRHPLPKQWKSVPLPLHPAARVLLVSVNTG